MMPAAYAEGLNVALWERWVSHWMQASRSAWRGGRRVRKEARRGVVAAGGC